MLLQQDNDHIDISYNSYALTVAGLEKTERGGQSCLALSVGAQLDPGIRRKHGPNEDTILITHGIIPSHATTSQPFVLLAVGDGMGGVGHGQEASQLATRSLVEYVSHSLCSQQGPYEDWLSLLKAGVQYANRLVYEHSLQKQTAMGTTMTAALVSDTTAYVAHVGDSRLYLYRELAGLVQKTCDHSLVATLVEEGIIAPTTFTPIPNAIKSIAASAMKTPWKWTPLLSRLPLATSCYCAPTGSGKWCATSRSSPS